MQVAEHLVQELGGHEVEVAERVTLVRLGHEKLNTGLREGAWQGRERGWDRGTTGREGVKAQRITAKDGRGGGRVYVYTQCTREMGQGVIIKAQE